MTQINAKRAKQTVVICRFCSWQTANIVRLTRRCFLLSIKSQGRSKKRLSSGITFLNWHLQFFSWGNNTPVKQFVCVCLWRSQACYKTKPSVFSPFEGNKQLWRGLRKDQNWEKQGRRTGSKLLRLVVICTLRMHHLSVSSGNVRMPHCAVNSLIGGNETDMCVCAINSSHYQLTWYMGGVNESFVIPVKSLLKYLTKRQPSKEGILQLLLEFFLPFRRHASNSSIFLGHFSRRALIKGIFWR